MFWNETFETFTLSSQVSDLFDSFILKNVPFDILWVGLAGEDEPLTEEEKAAFAAAAAELAVARKAERRALKSKQRSHLERLSPAYILVKIPFRFGKRLLGSHRRAPFTRKDQRPLSWKM